MKNHIHEFVLGGFKPRSICSSECLFCLQTKFDALQGELKSLNETIVELEKNELAESTSA